MSAGLDPAVEYHVVNSETLIAAMGAEASSDNYVVRLEPDTALSKVRGATVAGAIPHVSPQAVDGLNFSAALPQDLAAATLGERNQDEVGAAAVATAVLIVTNAQPHPGTGDNK